MGTCWNCNTEITLKEGRTNCDVCGEILKKRLSDKDSCQLYRGSFDRKNGKLT